MIGRRLLHYEIVEKLGEGGMGVVYKARDTHLDRFAAIKALPPERVADASRKARFVQEAEAASALNHPNIVTIYDISNDAGVDFIAMEYVDGKTLEQLIPRKGMRLNEALKIAVQIADALTRAHEAGIIHRDLKPANIMVDSHGQAKLLDFGLAKLTERSAPTEDDTTETLGVKTGEGLIAGTAAYMSPEQAEGKRLDARSDIFSFGAVLYEMVTGQRAFQGDSRMSTLSAVLHKEPALLGEEVPGDLRKLIARCLKKNPDRRFHIMVDVKVSLEELKEESESGVQPGAPGVPVRRRRWRWFAAAALLASMAAAGVWLYLRRQPPQPLKVSALSGLPGHAWSPSFSPDGQYVAFAWNGAKQDDDIWVQAVGEGAPFQITSGAAREFSPVWSPVGNRIAFLREKSQTYEIAVAPFPKGPEQVMGASSIFNPFLVGPTLRTAIGISWWPDGKHLLIVDRQPPDKIPSVFLLSIETGHKRRITTPRPGVEVDGMAIPSPDGRTIAFLRGGSPWAFDLHTLPVEPDGTPRGASVRLTHDGVWVEGFDWSADGRSLLFSSIRLGTRRLWRVPSGGGDPEPLPVGGDSAFLPAVARQGNRLAYARLLPESTIWRIEIDAARRGSPAPLIQSTRKDKHPDPSPDGRLVFTSLRSGTQEFWVSRADGSEAARISSFDSAPASFPKWSPDAAQIAFHGAAGEDRLWHVYLMSSRGGKARRLTQGRHHEVFPSWSTGGKWVYFSSYVGPARWISKTAADGSGKVIRLTREGCDAFQALEAASGKWVYFVGHDTPGIWRVPAAGGQEERVLERGSPGHWALFDNGVYLLNLSSPSRPVVEWQAMGEPQAKSVAVLPGHAWNYRGAEVGLVVSRDGRRLYLAGLDNGQGEIMIVENFR